MRTKGLLMKCDRCGKQQFFKLIGEKETDGGWQKWDKFEEREHWDCITGVGDVCPECATLYKEMLTNFKFKDVKKCDGDCQCCDRTCSDYV